MEESKVTEVKRQEEQAEPLMIKGQFANIVRKAQADCEFFHYDKADAAEGLAAVRYLMMELSPSDTNHKELKKKLCCIENSIYNLLYYIGLMESEDGQNI